MSRAKDLYMARHVNNQMIINMRKFEYKLVNFNPGITKVDSELNKHGEYGWELINMITYSTGYLGLILKRRKRKSFNIIKYLRRKTDIDN